MIKIKDEVDSTKKIGVDSKFVEEIDLPIKMNVKYY